MLRYYETDNEGRITVTSKYGRIMTDGTITGDLFDFPDNFDFANQHRWKIIDGELIEDTETISAEVAADVRLTRDSLLAECDWTVLPDSPFTDEQRAAWIAYRQALRDIPQQEGFPFDVTFPKKPE